MNFLLTVQRDMPSIAFFALALGVLAVPPLFAAFRHSAFEQMRWRESDYAPSSSDE